MERIKDKIPPPYPLPSSQGQLQPFTQNSSTFSSPSSTGDGEWGLWSAHNSSSLLLLSPQTFPCSSMSSPLGAGKSTVFHRIAFYIQV